jgi:hypothetical protein
VVRAAGRVAACESHRPPPLAILLKGDGNHAVYQATHIGLSARDTGTATYPEGESRLAMTVANWDLAGKVDDHPLVFVAKGTHDLYLGGGAQAVPQFSPQDFSASTCGAYETPDAESATKNAISAANDSADHTLEYNLRFPWQSLGSGWSHNRSRSNSCPGQASERRTSNPAAPDARGGRSPGRARFKEGKSGKFLRKSGRRPRKIGTCDHSRVPGMP